MTKFLKLADNNYVLASLFQRLHVDYPGPNGEWLLRGSGGSDVGTWELASYSTQAEAEEALARLAAGVGYVEVV